MATWHGAIAAVMRDAAGDLMLNAAKFKAGEIDAAKTRDNLAVLQAVLDDCAESLRRLAAQETEGGTP